MARWCHRRGGVEPAVVLGTFSTRYFNFTALGFSFSVFWVLFIFGRALQKPKMFATKPRVVKSTHRIPPGVGGEVQAGWEVSPRVP